MPKLNVYTLFCGECILKNEPSSTIQHWKILYGSEAIAIFQTKKYEKAIELFMTKKQDGTA